MLTDFSTEYAQRSDDELLHLASERHSLTTEAAAALDAELRRRNLTESDRLEYQKFVKRQERREWRRRRWKIPTPGLKDHLTWRDILEALGAMAFISFTYLALPSRYQLKVKADWQEAAVIVMITSVTVIFSAISWRKIAFWISLGIPSAIQLVPLSSAYCCSLSSMELSGSCNGCCTAKNRLTAPKERNRVFIQLASRRATRKWPEPIPSLRECRFVNSGQNRGLTEMGRQAAVAVYGAAMVAVIVGADFAFFRNRFWERLTVNIGIVLVFAAFYLRFLRRP